MKKLALLLMTASLLAGVMIFANPATAHHDRIYTPCGSETGFPHMTYGEWAAKVGQLESEGKILPGMVHRYWSAEHTTGKGTNVQVDGTIPAWDQWAKNLEEGQILSINDWANGNFPELEELMFSSGLVPEWILDPNNNVRRFNDTYWS